MHTYNPSHDKIGGGNKQTSRSLVACQPILLGKARSMHTEHTQGETEKGGGRKEGKEREEGRERTAVHTHAATQSHIPTGLDKQMSMSLLNVTRAKEERSLTLSLVPKFSKDPEDGVKKSYPQRN